MSERAEPLRALFVSEGDLDEIVGHATLQSSFKSAFADGERGIEAHFARLPPMTRAERLASGWVPGLGRLDLDLQPVRWHLVQAARARRVVRAERRRQRYDVLHVNTHSISFRLIEDWYDAGATVPLRAEPNVRLWQPPRRTG